MGKAAETWADVEQAIKQAVGDGFLVDRRDKMPRGAMGGRTLQWPTVEVGERLGVCVHQNGSRNTSDPVATARYHTSTRQHITPGRPLPTLCYHVALPASGPAQLCVDLQARTYGQGANDRHHPGEENTHLIALLVMGGFKGPAFNPRWAKDGPTPHQMKVLCQVVNWLMNVFDFGGEGVFGHYHFGKSGCPGHALGTWVEECRDKDDKASWADDREWQQALLRWNAGCLPRYGADGQWGEESISALVAFQRAHSLRVTKQQDPFTQLVLLQRYAPVPKQAAAKLELFAAGQTEPPAEPVKVTVVDEVQVPRTRRPTRPMKKGGPRGRGPKKKG